MECFCGVYTVATGRLPECSDRLLPILFAVKTYHGSLIGPFSSDIVIRIS